MSRDLLHEFMNGQNGVWIVAVIVGAMVGLLDLWLSYRGWRQRRRSEQRPSLDVEAVVPAALTSPEPAARLVREPAPLPIATLAPPRPSAEPPPRTQIPPPVQPPMPPADKAPPPERRPEPIPAPVSPLPPSFPRRRLSDTVDPSLTAEELLERAGQHLASGAREQAAVHYRGAIRMAQKAKLPALEAQARIELGDLSKANGDLTSACEHWQMARVLFAGLEQPDDVDATVARMEKAGCPTDWVLNEF